MYLKLFFFNNRVNSNTYFKVLGVNLDTLMSADDIKREGRDKDEEINEAVNSILLGKLCIFVGGECFGPKLSYCQSFYTIFCLYGNLKIPLLKVGRVQ